VEKSERQIFNFNIRSLVSSIVIGIRSFSTRKKNYQKAITHQGGVRPEVFKN
jgi:hypothetical protein